MIMTEIAEKMFLEWRTMNQALEDAIHKAGVSKIVETNWS